MFSIKLLLCFLHVYLFHTVQATSPLVLLESPPTAQSETTNLITVNHTCCSPANADNVKRLFFTDPGGPIPASELRHTLSVAIANVQTHFPRHADEPISESLFETNVTFADTGDNVYLWVYAYGHGLSWLQLSQALMLLSKYMSGADPDHPSPHYQQLEFYVQLTTGMETARGVVEFTPGTRAVTKRNPVTTTLQLAQVNLSSHLHTDLPIIFRIPKTNLDLNVTALGLPIPEYFFLTTIESAFTDIMLNHPDIDSSVPFNKPYSFNATFGKWQHESIVEIQITPAKRKSMSWGLLCLVYYGLRDFVQDLKHFNAMSFEVLDARLGKVGDGKVLYYPGDTASTAKWRLG